MVNAKKPPPHHHDMQGKTILAFRRIVLFLTNINLTIGEKEELVAHARAAGFASCEVIDRERIRIALDSPDGFSIRYQYLGLSLSEPEQASFFAKWGDDIQSVISTGFQKLEKSLERILFLQEASDVLSTLTLVFELDRTYSADEIGHFRAFCSMYLKEPKHQILHILFGSSDKPHRRREAREPDFTLQRPRIKHGISEWEWEEYEWEEYIDPDPSTDDEALNVRWLPLFRSQHGRHCRGQITSMQPCLIENPVLNNYRAAGQGYFSGSPGGFQN